MNKIWIRKLEEFIRIQRGYSAVVARSLCMWKAPGSIPGISKGYILLYYNPTFWIFAYCYIFKFHYELFVSLCKTLCLCFARLYFYRFDTASVQKVYLNVGVKGWFSSICGSNDDRVFASVNQIGTSRLDHRKFTYWKKNLLFQTGFKTTEFIMSGFILNLGMQTNFWLLLSE